MNVLLVDDQEKILEATHKLINWKNLHIDEVFTANSVAAAKKILSLHPIDIILTDIEMPVENGISLQQWLRKEYSAVACIFLTSHADFSYAKQAIHNGAFDYILQPASISEIEEVLGRCIGQLEARKIVDKKGKRYDAKLSGILEIHVFTMFHQKDQFSQMKEWRTESHTEEDTWWYLPCLMEIQQADSSEVREEARLTLESVFVREGDISVVISRLNNEELGILLYSKGIMVQLPLMIEKLKYVRELISKKIHCELKLYLGQYAKEDLPLRIGQILDYKSERVLKKNEVYLVDVQKNSEYREPNGAVWGRWLIRQDTILLKNQITNLLRFAEQEQYLTISYMEKLIHAFLEACSIACYEQGRSLSELFTDTFSYEQMLHAYSSTKELCKGVEFCLKQYTMMIDDKEGDVRSYSVQERIQEVLHYLDENMELMISRREAAKYIFINEDYFSRMFRKETNMGYKEYVLKHKMDYAGKLLAATDMPVALIASKVGYDNYSNFTQMFKKITGMLPTEYRKKYYKTAKSEK